MAIRSKTFNAVVFLLTYIADQQGHGSQERFMIV